MKKNKETANDTCNTNINWSHEAQKALKETEDLTDLYYWLDKRYAKESQELAILANRQLNLEKNVCKGDFEDLEIYHETKINIFSSIADELYELKNELLDDSNCCFDPECECGGNYVHYKKKEKINYQRAREEIGDVAACLVGLSAKLNKMEKEEK